MAKPKTRREKVSQFIKDIADESGVTEDLRGIARRALRDGFDTLAAGLTLQHMPSRYVDAPTGKAGSSFQIPPHAILGVTSDAPPEVVDAAYRALAKKYHPDNKETGNEARFKAIRSAYEQVMAKS